MARGGSRIKKRRGDAWTIVIGLIVLIFAAQLLGTAGTEQMAPPGSSYSTGSGGLLGIYTVLEEQGAARRWRLGLDRLGPEVDRVVLWDVGWVDPDHLEALLDWVAEGHAALVGGELEDLDAALETQVSLHQPGEAGERAAPAAAHPVTLGVDEVSVGPGRFDGSAGSGLPHLVGADGRPVLVSFPVGRGRLFWSADTEWLANGRIQEADNLDLALQLLLPAPGGVVAFDEYDHGYRAATHWWQILRGPLRLFVVLLALSVALLFWAHGARFGSPRPAPPRPPRAAVEYVYSMSQLYRRAGARRAVLEALYRSLRQELSRHLGGAQGLSHAEIAERTAAQLRLRPEAVEDLLNRLDPNRTRLPTEADLIRLSQEAEELQRRMKNAGYRDQRRTAEGAE